MSGTQEGHGRMFYSATRACRGNGASKASASSGVLRVSGATAHPRVPVTAPCPGKDALPFLSPAPWLCMDATKESLFPEIKARLLPGRERGGRREIRGSVRAVPALIPAGPLPFLWESGILPGKGFLHPTPARGRCAGGLNPPKSPNLNLTQTPALPITEGEGC